MENHPRERDIAGYSDGRVDEEIRRHVAWCSDCRRVLADHAWLEGELVETLRTQATEARLPSSDWEGVRRRLQGPEQERVESRPMIAAGVAMMLFVLAAAPMLLGSDVHAQLGAGSTLATAPRPVIATGVKVARTASLPLDHVSAPGNRHLSLPFVPPPTPPEGPLSTAAGLRR